MGPGDGHPRFVLEIWAILAVQRPQPSHIDETVHDGDIVVLQLEFFAQQRQHFIGHVADHFQAHGPTETPPPKLHLHGRQQIVGLSFGHGEIGISGDSERVRTLDGHAGKQR